MGFRAVFAISLDNTRNRIARMNLSLSMSTLSLSFSMVVAGFFGMNITSGLESHPPLVFAGIVAGGLVGEWLTNFVMLPRRESMVY
jgi:Mg2+ and Co2+ transporter CorA